MDELESGERQRRLLHSSDNNCAGVTTYTRIGLDSRGGLRIPHRGWDAGCLNRNASDARAAEAGGHYQALLSSFPSERWPSC